MTLQVISAETITAIRKNSVFIKETELPIRETYLDEVEKLIKSK